MDKFVAFTQFLLTRGIISSPTLWKDTAQKAQQQIQQKANAAKIHSKANFWRKIVFFITLPALIGAVAYVAFEKFQESEHERPEFVPYEYLRIRRKRFPWGDGQKSLFHNSKVNALPDGYEELDEDEEGSEGLRELADEVEDD